MYFQGAVFYQKQSNLLFLIFLSHYQSFIVDNSTFSTYLCINLQ